MLSARRLRPFLGAAELRKFGEGDFLTAASLSHLTSSAAYEKIYAL